MSNQTRPKPTDMVVCDLCDNEIEEFADGSAGRANLMTRVSPIGQVTNKTRWALLCWGRRRLDAMNDPIPTANYDFHGACIARLVESAIAERKSTAQEATK